MAKQANRAISPAQAAAFLKAQAGLKPNPPVDKPDVTNLIPDDEYKVIVEADVQAMRVANAKKLLEGLGYSVTKQTISTGKGKMPRVKVKANGILYDKLTDALKAHDFNIGSDWVEIRKHLKADGIYIKDGVEFELA